MRIISKFKDYYDGVQSLGQDNSLIYFRKTETIDTPTENETDKFLDQLVNDHDVKCIRGENELYLAKVILGFCGQLIKCTCAQWTREGQFEAPLFFFSKEELIEYIRPYEKVLVVHDFKFRSGISWEKAEKMHWTEFISEIEPITGNHNEIFHALKKPVFLYPAFVFNYELVKNFRYWYKPREKSKIIVDPQLKSIGFQRVKDAYQCYQDLAQYISGVLGNTEKEGDDRSDLEKVRSHGFDEKYGFRTRKKE